MIISPSSFTGNQRETTLPVFVAQHQPENMDVSSKYLTQESVQVFRHSTILSGSRVENDVITEPVVASEVVTNSNVQPPHFFYMYTSVIEDFNIWFPFTPFEVSVLRTLNVAPSQLSPNSWGYMKAFQLACLGYEIENPSVAVFFSFFTYYHTDGALVPYELPADNAP
jgi:hypothetical protein